MKFNRLRARISRVNGTFGRRRGIPRVALACTCVKVFEQVWCREYWIWDRCWVGVRNELVRLESTEWMLFRFSFSAKLEWIRLSTLGSRTWRRSIRRMHVEWAVQIFHHFGSILRPLFMYCVSLFIIYIHEYATKVVTLDDTFTSGLIYTMCLSLVFPDRFSQYQPVWKYLWYNRLLANSDNGMCRLILAQLQLQGPGTRELKAGLFEVHIAHRL